MTLEIVVWVGQYHEPDYETYGSVLVSKVKIWGKK